MEDARPMIIGYSRDKKGRIIGHHLNDYANTLTQSSGTGNTTDQFIITEKFSNNNNMNDQEPNYRIRKLTPRECFRLMDVDDADIDKMLNATDEIKRKSKGVETIEKKRAISNSQCYKLAGNSIVVSCLYHIFRKLYIDTTPAESIQLEMEV